MGLRIGQGESIAAILQQGNMVAEGYYAAQLLVHRQLPQLPILTAVQNILAQVQTPAQAFQQLEGNLR
jgi:glycerol-3-phosphate dehydrogenase